MKQPVFPLTHFQPDVDRYVSALRSSNHWSHRLDLVESFIRKNQSHQGATLLPDGAISIPLTEGAEDELQTLVSALTPWRIGPYQLGELRIDSEWQSQIKWNDIAPYLGDLEGLRIVDVGASSGYFSMRMALDSPECLLAIDPNERCWLQLHLVNGLSRAPSIVTLPLSLHHLSRMPHYFDLTVCMGVIYHQRDPIQALEVMRSATRPGGRVLIETLGVPGASEKGLQIKGRYAKMRNVPCIPTAISLERWMVAAGLVNVEVKLLGPISTTEQRRTEFAPYESLNDFLDPNDSTKTVEGYPAPLRIIGIGVNRA